jgi:hypothetical protein
MAALSADEARGGPAARARRARRRTALLPLLLQWLGRMRAAADVMGQQYARVVIDAARMRGCCGLALARGSVVVVAPAISGLGLALKDSRCCCSIVA